MPGPRAGAGGQERPPGIRVEHVGAVGAGDLKPLDVEEHGLGQRHGARQAGRRVDEDDAAILEAGIGRADALGHQQAHAGQRRTGEIHPQRVEIGIARRAGAADHDVVAEARQDQVVAVAGGDLRVAGAAHLDHVVAALRQDQRIGIGFQQQAVVSAAQLDRARQVLGQADVVIPGAGGQVQDLLEILDEAVARHQPALEGGDAGLADEVDHQVVARMRQVERGEVDPRAAVQVEGLVARRARAGRTRQVAAAHQQVRIVAERDHVRAEARQHDIRAAGGDDRVGLVQRAGIHPVAALAEDQREALDRGEGDRLRPVPRAGADGDGAIAIGIGDQHEARRHVLRAVMDQLQGVDAAFAAHVVAPRPQVEARVQHVVAPVAAQQVVETAGDQVLDLLQRVALGLVEAAGAGGQVDRDGARRRAVIGPVDARAAAQVVGSVAPDQAVEAAAPFQQVVAIAALQPVGLVVADDPVVLERADHVVEAVVGLRRGDRLRGAVGQQVQPLAQQVGAAPADDRMARGQVDHRLEGRGDRQAERVGRRRRQERVGGGRREGVGNDVGRLAGLPVQEAAAEEIGPAAHAEDGIAARPRIDHVRAAPADDRVGPVQSEDRIGGPVAPERVTLAREHEVLDIHVGVALRLAAGAEAAQQVDPHPGEREGIAGPVVAIAAVEQVGAAPAGQQVGALAAEQPVVAVAAFQHVVVVRGAAQHVVEARADQALDRHQHVALRVAAGAQHHPVARPVGGGIEQLLLPSEQRAIGRVPFGDDHRLGALRVIDRVLVAPAIEHVRVRAAVEEVAAGAAEQQVDPVAAAQDVAIGAAQDDVVAVAAAHAVGIRRRAVGAEVDVERQRHPRIEDQTVIAALEIAGDDLHAGDRVTLEHAEGGHDDLVPDHVALVVARQRDAEGLVIGGRVGRRQFGIVEIHIGAQLALVGAAADIEDQLVADHLRQAAVLDLAPLRAAAAGAGVAVEIGDGHVEERLAQREGERPDADAGDRLQHGAEPPADLVEEATGEVCQAREPVGLGDAQVDRPLHPAAQARLRDAEVDAAEGAHEEPQVRDRVGHVGAGRELRVQEEALGEGAVAEQAEAVITHPEVGADAEIPFQPDRERPQRRADAQRLGEAQRRQVHREELHRVGIAADPAEQERDGGVHRVREQREGEIRVQVELRDLRAGLAQPVPDAGAHAAQGAVQRAFHIEAAGQQVADRFAVEADVADGEILRRVERVAVERAAEIDQVARDADEGQVGHLPGRHRDQVAHRDAGDPVHVADAEGNVADDRHRAGQEVDHLPQREGVEHRDHLAKRVAEEGHGGTGIHRDLAQRHGRGGKDIAQVDHARFQPEFERQVGRDRGQEPLRELCLEAAAQARRAARRERDLRGGAARVELEQQVEAAGLRPGIEGDVHDPQLGGAVEAGLRGDGEAGHRPAIGQGEDRGLRVGQVDLQRQVQRQRERRLRGGVDVQQRAGPEAEILGEGDAARDGLLRAEGDVQPAVRKRRKGEPGDAVQRLGHGLVQRRAVQRRLGQALLQRLQRRGDVGRQVLHGAGQRGLQVRQGAQAGADHGQVRGEGRRDERVRDLCQPVLKGLAQGGDGQRIHRNRSVLRHWKILKSKSEKNWLPVHETQREYLWQTFSERRDRCRRQPGSDAGKAEARFAGCRRERFSNRVKSMCEPRALAHRPAARPAPFPGRRRQRFGQRLIPIRHIARIALEAGSNRTRESWRGHLSRRSSRPDRVAHPNADSRRAAPPIGQDLRPSVQSGRSPGSFRSASGARSSGMTLLRDRRFRTTLLRWCRIASAACCGCPRRRSVRISRCCSACL